MKKIYLWIAFGIAWSLGLLWRDFHVALVGAVGIVVMGLYERYRKD